MSEDDKTPTDKPIPPVPAPTGEAKLDHLADALADTPSFAHGTAPTITLEEDDAGELHETPTVPAAAAPAELADQGEGQPAGVELCGARCGTAKIFCRLEAGHEDPKHPAHVKNDHGEALHVAPEVRWPVDVEAAETAANERMRQAFERSKNARRDAGEV